jgi:hypothetical protein
MNTLIKEIALNTVEGIDDSLAQIGEVWIGEWTLEMLI